MEITRRAVDSGGFWGPLLAALEAESEAIADATAEKLLVSVPCYDLVPKEALAASARRNIAVSVRTIRAGDDPEPTKVTPSVTSEQS